MDLDNTANANEQIKTLVETLGADFFGIADLTSVQEAILYQGRTHTDICADVLNPITTLPSAISIGVILSHAIVDQLPYRAEPAVSMNYNHHGYTLVNQRLDHVAARVSSALQRAGYRTYPVPASQTVDTKRLRGVFSHKMAARMAGLGWIGKSCLLVTPEVGPRVRWATVLTDAPLTATGSPMEERCGTCQQCVEICPAQAFTGQPFRPEDPREVRFDAHKCKAYFDKMAETASGPSVCGLCLYVCPYGHSASSGVEQS